MTMTVLVNAGPWLSVPPPGYGGIENVIGALVPLTAQKLGIDPATVSAPMMTSQTPSARETLKL